MNIKAFVINLDRRVDRMQELSVPFEFERFPATDGTQFTDIPKLRMRGHIGCWDSHRRLLTKIRDEHLPMALVFEDDVELCDAFVNRLVTVMAELPPDWDLLYVGGWNVGEPVKQYSEHLNVAERVLTTHAYIIRNKFVNVLLDVVENNKNKIDVVFSLALERGKCYIAHPVLAWQREGYSDITNSVNTNEHLK